jgi:hypothetical protein
VILAFPTVIDIFGQFYPYHRISSDIDVGDCNTTVYSDKRFGVFGVQGVVGGHNWIFVSNSWLFGVRCRNFE